VIRDRDVGVKRAGANPSHELRNVHIGPASGAPLRCVRDMDSASFATVTTSSRSSIPGPADRVSFFDEQKRRRRQTWRYAVLSALAAAVFGVPLMMFLTPLAFLIAAVSLSLLNGWMPVPAAAWNVLADLAGFVPAFLTALADAPDEDVWLWLQHAVDAVDYPFGSPSVTLAALLVPGMAIMVLVWLGYRSLFSSVGVGGALLALGAREPRADDLEERQVVNVVEEMAIAAGLPPPEVRMLDTNVPNAAAIGISHEQATVVITRGLLDRMDRDETQGVIAHLIGSIGNGDLRIALSVTTVFQALELIFTLLDALFNLSPAAWRDLRWTLRLAWSRGRSERAAAIVAQQMDRRLGEFHEDGIHALIEDAQRDRPRGTLARMLKRLPVLYVPFMPFLLLYILALFLRMQVNMFRLVFVAPLLIRVLRARRLLADATAVQLTRQPDGLALALKHLAEEGAVAPGGQWFAHLFIVGPEAAQARAEAVLHQQLASVRSGEGRDGAGGRPVAALRAVREHVQGHEAGSTGSWSQELAGVPSHPSIATRMHRLAAQGAGWRAHESGDSRPLETGRWRQSLAGTLAVAIVIGPLLAVAGVLMVFALSMIFLFGAVAALFFMGLAMAGIHALVT
jgi:Zn-dependent protease with chaperone function